MEMEEIPLQDLGNLAEQVHVAQQGKQQPTLILTCENFSRIDKALRSFKGEIVNNLAKLSEVDKQLNRDRRKKLEEIKDDSSCSDELKDSIRERIDEKKHERKTRIEALSINRNKLRKQVSRIKETLAEMSDSNTSPLEKLWIFLQEQWILLTATITAFAGILSTIILAITGGGRGSGGGADPPKDKLVAWVKDKLKCLSNALKHLARKLWEHFQESLGLSLEQFLTFLLKLLALQRLMSGHLSPLLSLLLPPGYIVKLLVVEETTRES